VSDFAPTVRPWPGCPLVVAYGLGIDSTAMLVELVNRGIRPDMILFADTGGEKPETYRYLDVIQPFLAKIGFAAMTTVGEALLAYRRGPRCASLASIRRKNRAK
jgi:hypothetical protein